ncbi:MAG: rhodanese-like domain-containing protein [Ginsengibacter sp.]
MKKSVFSIYSLTLLLLITACNHSSAQKPENWTKDQLVEPADLANIIKSNKDIPVLISVGPGAIIPNSIDIGGVNEEANMTKFKQKLSELPKSSNIVIYCGCCPFARCPNVRPAIAYLQSEQFTDYHLLNIPNNIKTDWISKGYPVTD